MPVASYRLWIDRWASLADIVRLSEDDLDLLWPGWTPEQAALHLHACGVPLAVVSLAGQFLPGMAILRADGYDVPARPVLVATGGNQSEAARRLGMSRGALLARLRAWGLTGKRPPRP